jgi:cysteine-rich repeat protein
VNVNDNGLTPQQVGGNCKAEVCSNGAVSSTNNDQDLPTDDGEPCTKETCEGGVPGKVLLNDVECELGGKTGYCKTGKCQVDCSQASECEDSNPCTQNGCNNGKCEFTPLTDGTATPGASDTAGDCKKSVCSGGVATDGEDLADLPAASSECQIPKCTAQGPSFDNKPGGTACGGGAQLCVAGQCKASTCGDGFRFGTEECDGADLGGKSCTDFGFGPGATGLACDGGCKLTAAACQGVCGNGVKEPGEDCDDATTPGAPGGGCSKFCKEEPAVGDLVITELMYNPNAAPTSGGNVELGEWFEVLNTSSKAYDVRGLQITSKTNGELHVIEAATPLVIAPGAYVTFTRGANSTETTGFTPFYTYGSKLSFSNSSADYVHLEIATTPPVLLDSLEYTPSNSYNGKSYSLSPTKLTHTENDVAANFCPSKSEFGVADINGIKDKGTPGAPNDSCP